MNDTIETVYAQDEDEDTATERVRIVGDDISSFEDMVCAGDLQFVDWRRLPDFYSTLNNASEEFNEEVLGSGGIVFDGSRYWVEGPDDRDGRFFLSFPTRKEAQENGRPAVKDLEFALDGIYGFIYETRCDCCGTWEVQISLWGITGTKLEKYAEEYLSENRKEAVC